MFYLLYVVLRNLKFLTVTGETRAYLRNNAAYTFENALC